MSLAHHAKRTMVLDRVIEEKLKNYGISSSSIWTSFLMNNFVIYNCKNEIIYEDKTNKIDKINNNPLVGGRDIEGLNFKNCHIISKSFENGIFSANIFEHTKIEDVNFDHDIIMNSNFMNCKLENSIFRGVLLDRVMFFNCIFINVVFIGATFKETNFKESKFFNVEFGKDELGGSCRFSNVSLLSSEFNDTIFDEVVSDEDTKFPVNLDFR